MADRREGCRVTAYRFSRRRVFIWDLGDWVLTDDHRVWRVAYLRGAR